MYTQLNNEQINQEVSEGQSLLLNTSSRDQSIYRGVGTPISNLPIEEQLRSLSITSIVEEPLTLRGKINPYYKALYKEGTDTLLGVIPYNWQYLQPREVVEIFYNFCQKFGLEQDRIGTYGNVSSIKTHKDTSDVFTKENVTLFVSAKLNTSFDLGDKDITKGRIILRFPYIYTKGIPLNILSERLVCTNMMSLPVRLKGKNISHTCSVETTLAARLLNSFEDSMKLWTEHQNEMSMYTKVYAKEEEAILAVISSFAKTESFQALAKEALADYLNGNQVQALKVMNTLYESDSYKDEASIVQDVLAMYFANNFIGSNLFTCQNTFYGLLNCVTEYINHYRTRTTSFQSLVEGHKHNQIQKFNRTIKQMALVKYSPF